MASDRSHSWVEKFWLLWVLLLTLYGPLATGAVRARDFLVLLAILAVGLAVWSARALLDGSFKLVWPPVNWLVLGFVVYAIVASTRADLSYPAQAELLRVAAYAAAYFLALEVFQNQKHSTWFIYGLACLGTAVSAYAVYQYAADSPHVWTYVRPAGYAGRGSGTYICPNHLAGLLALSLPPVAALAIGGKRTPVARVLLGYALLAMLGGLGVTFSRGGWFAAGVGIFALLLVHLWQRQHPRRAWALFAALAMLVTAAIGFSAAAKGRLRSTVEGFGSADSGHVRLSIWSSTVAMWRERPWLGVGPGHFDFRYPAYRLPEVQARPTYAHNDYLNTLAEWGVVGTGLTAAVFGLTLFSAGRLLSRLRREGFAGASEPSERWSLLCGAACGIVALLAHSVFDFNMHVPANALLTVVLMALIGAHERFKTRATSLRPPLAGRLPLALAALGAAVWLLSHGYSLAREASSLEAARQATGLEEKTAALRQALQRKPDNSETWYELGEAYRAASWSGGPSYVEQAEQAAAAFRQAVALNPFDPYSHARLGMCLDWTGSFAEAGSVFERAISLDPNNHHLRILHGWHYLQTADYVAARKEFARSLQIMQWPNPTAANLLARTDRLLKETPAAKSTPRVGEALPPRGTP